MASPVWLVTRDATVANAHLYELFCHTVSPRRRFRADPDGTHTFRDAPIPKTPPTYPYALYLAREGIFRLLVFDLDAKVSRKEVDADLKTLERLLASAAIDYIVTRSGPTGGRHVWAAFPAGVDAELVMQLANGLSRVLPTLDVGPLANPATGCARPPGAPHRLGGYAELDSPVAAADAEDILRRGNPVDRLHLLLGALPPAARTAAVKAVANTRVTRCPDGAPKLTGTRRALSPGTDRLLYHADPAEDASAVTWAILLRCAYARFSLADVEKLVDDPAATGLEHIRSRRNGTAGRSPRAARERRALLSRQWAKAVQHAADAPIPQTEDDGRVKAVTAAVEAVEAAAAACPWRWATPAGPADREALRALCLMALTCCSVVVSLDVRRWATLTGYARSTMAAAAHRLATDHTVDGPAWISLHIPAEGRLAATWRIHGPTPDPRWINGVVAAQMPTVDKSRTQGRQPAPLDGVNNHPLRSGVLGRLRDELVATVTRQLTTASHDVWTPRGGLGHTTQRTFAAIDEGASDVRTTSNLTGYSERTVRCHVRRLASCGLVTDSGGGRLLRGPNELDTVAEDLGVDGVGARRSRGHAIDRELHQWWLDEQAWRSTPAKLRLRRRTATYNPLQQQIPVATNARVTYGPFPTRPTPLGRGRADYRTARRRVRDHLESRQLVQAEIRTSAPIDPNAGADDVAAAIALLQRRLGAELVAA